MQKKCVIYARVSSKKQAEEDISIPAQIAAAKSKAEELSAQVIEVFTDAGRSAYSGVARPAFDDALRLATTLPVDYFICWSPSRFSRRAMEAAMYHAELDENGVQLVFITGNMDRKTDEGWLAATMQDLFNEYSSRVTARDTLRSMLSNARNGYFNGGKPPFGYTVVPDPQNPKRKRLAINESERRIVQEIFRLRLDGSGAHTIAMHLNERGETNRGKRWHKSTVAALLRNEALAGRTVFGKKSKRTGKIRPREKWVIVDSHQPIIDEETFNQVQSLMDSATTYHGRSSPKSTHIFTGILKCGRCGSSMQIETATGRSKQYSYYNCRGALKHGTCEHRRIPTDALDSWLTDVILERVFSDQNMVRVAKMINEFAGSWERDRREKLKSLYAEINRLQTANNNLFALLEQHGPNTPNLGDLTERLRANKDKIRELNQEASDLEEREPPDVEITQDDIDDLRNFLIHIVKTAENPVKIRTFFNKFINEIRVLDSEVVVDYEPASLIEQRIPVHSHLNWLPAPVRVRTIRARLPSRFCVETTRPETVSVPVTISR